MSGELDDRRVENLVAALGGGLTGRDCYAAYY